MRLLFGHDDLVGKYVADRIPHADANWGPHVAIGVVNDEGRVIAGAVYNMYYPEFGTIQVSMAADDPKWASKNTRREILSYAFDNLGVNKVWIAIPHKSDRVIQFNKRIGFKQEAVLAHHFGPGTHSVICRMLKKDFEAQYG